MARLRVVVLDEELPWPINSGKRIRTYQLLTRLARWHELHFITRSNADPAEVAPAVAEFARCGIATTVVPCTLPPRRGLRFGLRLVGNLFSPLPYSVASHLQRPYLAAIAAHARTAAVDLWHCEWTPYAQHLRAALGARLDGCRWVVMAHNVESLIWQRYAEHEPQRFKRWYIEKQLNKFRRFERWAYSSATRTIAVSQADADLIRHQYHGRDVSVVENGVDPAWFKPNEAARREPASLLFMGSLDWRPNLDAVDSLLHEILPRVRQAVPEVRVRLVGRNPSPELRQRLARYPQVQLHANVEDVRPYLHAASALIVPLRIGGGSRLKILEALAAGTPVISTAVGAEGLPLVDGQHAVVVPTAASMVPHIVALCHEATPFLQQAERGRRLVVERFGWDRLAEKLNRAWVEAAGVGRVDPNPRLVDLPYAS